MPARLIEARKRANVGVVQLDSLAGVGKGTTTRLESGDRIADIETLFRIARALRLNLHWLMTGEGPREGVFHSPAAERASGD